MESQEIVISPIFDFSSYFKDSILTDCELLVHDSPNGPVTSNIRAHRLVLSSSSEFFYNAFTSGMKESVENRIDIFSNPLNQFPRVVQWMYNGTIDITEENFIPLLNIAHTYGIVQLESDLKSYLESRLNVDILMKLVNRCYDLECQDQLQVLEPYMADLFNQIPIQMLSDALDVDTFISVITKAGLPVEDRIKKTTEFLGSYELTDEEKDHLFKIIGDLTPDVRQLVRQYKVTWLPERFLNTCK